MWPALWTTHPAPVPKAAELPRRSPGVCAVTLRGGPTLLLQAAGTAASWIRASVPRRWPRLCPAPRGPNALWKRGPRAPRAILDPAGLSQPCLPVTSGPEPTPLRPVQRHLPGHGSRAPRHTPSVRVCSRPRPGAAPPAPLAQPAARWLCHAAQAVALSPPSPPSPLIRQCPPRRRAASEPREGTRASFLLDGGVCTPGGVRVGSCERLSLSSVLRWEDTRVSGSASRPGREPVGAAARSAGPRGWGLSPWRARALRRHEAQRRVRTRVRTPLNRLPTSRPRPEARPEGQAGERPWPQAPVSERPRPARLCSPPAGASSQPRSLDLLYRELK